MSELKALNTRKSILKNDNALGDIKMECLVCREKIKLGEQVFWGSQMVCDGPGDVDFRFILASDDSMGAIHLSCLESPTAVVRMPNTATPEPVEEESVVQRSDALGIFEGI